ncbi:MAG: Plasma membrane t-SNARE, secretory vesicle fusion [Piccolia ochrophora]|nr:MAG: Plasma membrane t-SNARE, secretory vesicle fusion [Piccolia ochrophora]
MAMAGGDRGATLTGNSPKEGTVSSKAVGDHMDDQKTMEVDKITSLILDLDNRSDIGFKGYGNDVEMAPLNGQSGNQGQSTGQDPNAILNACREIDRGLDAIDDKLEQVKRLQQQSLSSADASGNTGLNRDLENASNGTMDLYRNLGARIKQIKSQPESGSPKNAPQVGRVDRRLKAAINKYQTLDRDYRRQLQAAFERQYRIVRPDASDAEVREAVEDTSNNQIFSQALLQSDRRGQAQTTIQNVKNRHEAIQKIERDMIELAQLFQDMEALVVQQEPAVAQIEQKGEQVTEDVGRANTEISGAIEKARSRNRKKWWCLLIVLLIIIVIVVVAVVVTLVNKNKK